MQLEHKEIENFKYLRNDFPTTEDALWDKIEAKIENPERSKVIPLRIWRSIAAVFVLALATVSFMKFYTKTIPNNTDSIVLHNLPDGSTVAMQSKAILEYAPYWFSLSRELNFQGEGFFDVEKGSRFTVYSKQGNTTVLGTSFTIYAEQAFYDVHCTSGKVKVQGAKQKDFFLLLPGEMAMIENNIGTAKKIAATQKEFHKTHEKRFEFKEISLDKALEHIAAVYHVSITFDKETIAKERFSASFNRPKNVMEALQIVFDNFEYKIHTLDDKNYQIIE